MEILEDKKFIICDVDGTIFDRMSFYIAAFSEICGRYGISSDVAKTHFIQTAGEVLSRQFETLLEKESVNFTPETIKKCCDAFWIKVKNVPAPLFPGARETLETLYKEGKTLFASSGSNEDELINLFTGARLPPFAMILGSDRIPKGKEHIRHFATYAKMSLEEFVPHAVFISDGPTDMRVAKECRIFAIGITTTNTAETLLGAGANVAVPLLSSIIE